MNNFKCIRCGDCCKIYVKISDEDIKQIESVGYKLNDVAEFDSFDPSSGKYALRLIDGKCIFLKQKNNKYKCEIYDNRPKICRTFPFFETTAICRALKKRG